MFQYDSYILDTDTNWNFCSPNCRIVLYL